MRYDWRVERAIESVRPLVVIAKSGYPNKTTYSELAPQIGIGTRQVGAMLGFLRDRVCRANGLPLLNYLVVKRGTGEVGDGAPPDRSELWEPEDERRRCYEFDWDRVDWAHIFAAVRRSA